MKNEFNKLDCTKIEELVRTNKIDEYYYPVQKSKRDQYERINRRNKLIFNSLLGGGIVSCCILAICLDAMVIRFFCLLSFLLFIAIVTFFCINGKKFKRYEYICKKVAVKIVNRKGRNAEYLIAELEHERRISYKRVNSRMVNVVGHLVQDQIVIAYWVTIKGDEKVIIYLDFDV